MAETQPLDEERNPNRIRRILFGLIILIIVCLVGFLVYNLLFVDSGDQVAVETPAPTEEVTAEPTADPDAEPTATPTRVINEEPTEEPTKAPSPTATSEPTVVVQPEGTPETTTVVTYVTGPSEEIVQNGGFEDGFAANGVGLNWNPFKSDGILAAYGAEVPGVYVYEGKTAQRIQTSQASLGDRYSGIYQQLNVIAGEPYTLEMHGQIRSGVGDVNKSSFGYRMQYAISHSGVKNWQVVPAEDWVELPWDEQLLDAPDTTFTAYTTEIVPTSDTITLFIRAWNKWADPGEVHFTVDSVSLIGPSVIAQTEIISSASSGQAFTPTSSEGETTTASEGEEPGEDQMLPVTGQDEALSILYDGRFWGAVLIILLLAVGATYRAKWSY